MSKAEQQAKEKTEKAQVQLENQNSGHNAKKAGLGPNTKR